MSLTVWLSLAGSAGLLLAFLVWLIYRAGGQDAKIAKQQEALDDAKTRTDVESGLDRASADELERLRRKWTRL